MKKERVSPTTNLTPSVNTDSFKQSVELPTPETVKKSVQAVNQVQPTERNKRKRETQKGTILQAVMIEKDLLKKVKHSAFYNEKSISEVINQALRLFYD